jgi:hypothetical protein
MNENQTVQITGKIVGYKVIDKKAEQIEAKVEIVKPTVGEIKRPERLSGVTYKLKSPLAKAAMYVTINDIINDDGSRQPFEIFVYSKDSTHYEWITALTRMISACFRRGGDLKFILEELECIMTPGGSGYIAKGGRHVPSLVAEISLFAIREHFKSLGIIETVQHDEFVIEYLKSKKEEYIAKTGDTDDNHTGYPKNAVICPSCQTKAMIPMDNCMTCLSCGDSKCS